MNRKIGLVFAVILSVAGIASGADVDQSTPKAAAMGFAKAMENGDAALAKELSVGSEQDQKVLSSMLEFTGSIKKLRDSASKKYGDKADEVTGGGMNVDSSKLLEDAQIQENGDTATVMSGKPQPSAMNLKKVDGKWKVDLSTTLKNASGPGQDIEQFQQMLKGWTSAINETATEIDDGKYTAPAEASQALQVKMMAALKSVSATTEPSTAPSEGATTQPAK